MEVEELYQASRFDEFEQALLQLLADPLYSTDLKLQMVGRLGRYYRRIGNWAAAERAYGSLLGSGDERQCQAILHDLKFRQGRFEAVVEDGRILAPIFASEPVIRARVLVRMARACLALGERDQAENWLRQAQDSDPANGLAPLLADLMASDGKVVSALVVGLALVEDMMGPLSAAEKSYRLYRGPEALDDVSFVVLGGDGCPALGVRLLATPDGIQASDGGAIVILALGGARVSDKLIHQALDHLARLVQAFGGHALIEEPSQGALSAIGTACWKRGLVAHTQISMDIDLTQPQGDLWKGIRDSNRSLIHRGQDRLTARYLNAQSQDWDLFEQMRQCHYRVSPEPVAEAVFFTLPVVRQQIQAGHAELAVYFDGAQAVAAVMVTDVGPTTYYAFARYPKDASDNASRFSLWDAILRAKARGQTRFHLGLADPAAETPAKLRHIAAFKAGFTRTPSYRMFWRQG